MVCGQYSLYDENPVREAQRAERTAAKHAAAAEKIVQFFQELGRNTCVASSTRDEVDARRIEVKRSTGGLLVRHRGYAFTISTSDPEFAMGMFQVWCKTNMTHARLWSNGRQLRFV